MILLDDLVSYLCDANAPIRDALARLNKTEHLFLLVTDNDNCLVGTMTDGDIRRGILRGLDLNAPARACMHTDFVVGNAGADQNNHALLQARQNRIRFLPVVDANSRPVQALVLQPDAGVIEAALVMAGGPGKRLGERTRGTPKPLLPVGGRPILDRVLEGLENAGVRKTFVSVHYLSEQIERFIADRQNANTVKIVQESEPMGTAGALGELADQSLGKAILVVNGDVLTSVDYDALRAFHGQHEFDATVAVAQYETVIPFGVVRQSGDGLFEGIDEKPRQRHFVAAGVYYLSPAVLALVPPARAVDMPEVLNRAREAGLKIGLFPIHEYWTDVGRPDDLEAADLRVRETSE